MSHLAWHLLPNPTKHPQYRQPTSLVPGTLHSRRRPFLFAISSPGRGILSSHLAVSLSTRAPTVCYPRRESGGRLLAAGVLGVIGAFASGQAVRVVTPKHRSVFEHLIAPEPSGFNSSGSTRPTTPSIVAASSVSSSIASLEPLSRSGSFSALSEAVTDKLVEPEEPQFQESEVVEIGRGLAMYNSAELNRIKGLKRCAVLVSSFSCVLTGS